jgi:hypothetical protein
VAKRRHRPVRFRPYAMAQDPSSLDVIGKELQRNLATPIIPPVLVSARCTLNHPSCERAHNYSSGGNRRMLAGSRPRTFRTWTGTPVCDYALCLVPQRLRQIANNDCKAPK